MSTSVLSRQVQPVDTGPVRVDATVRAGAVTLAGASLLVVTWLWVRGGGVGDLTGWAAGLTSLGRWTGLLGSDLLLVQVLLMARIPALEHAVGQDRLARLRRLAGFASFTLMLAHIGLVAWGYASGRLVEVPSTFWDLTVSYPGMLLALAGTLCLVMVVVTSIRAACSRLRYESWHLLHLYAYLGVGLALPHRLWTGQEFLASTAATVYWWTLWIAAVLVFRLGLPVIRSLRHGLRVVAVVPEADDTVSVHITGRALDRLPVTAGQFLMWRFLSGPGWTRAHPYSLRRPGQAQLAHHGQGPRRRQRPRPRHPPRHPVRRGQRHLRHGRSGRRAVADRDRAPARPEPPGRTRPPARRRRRDVGDSAGAAPTSSTPAPVVHRPACPPSRSSATR